MRSVSDERLAAWTVDPAGQRAGERHEGVGVDAERDAVLLRHHRVTPTGLEQRQRRLPAIGRDLERTTLEPRRPEVVLRDGFEPEMLCVPSGGLRSIRHTDVHVVEPSHSES